MEVTHSQNEQKKKQNNSRNLCSTHILKFIFGNYTENYSHSFRRCIFYVSKQFLFVHKITYNSISNERKHRIIYFTLPECVPT